jgi:hypothetical protein
VRAAVPRLVLALFACLLLAPAAAQAFPGQAVVQDCTDNGRFDHHHSLEAYTQALANLPSDVIEYTDCASLIRRAQLLAAGSGKHRSATTSSKSSGKSSSGKSSSGGGGGSSHGGGGSSSSAGASSPPPASPSSLATATPAQRTAVSQAIESGGAPIRVGRRLLQPAALASGSGGAPSAMPTALLLLLVALAACGLGIGGASLVPRVHARRAR